MRARLHATAGWCDQRFAQVDLGCGACRTDNQSRSHRTTYRVPRPLSISNPVRLRFDDFELDEANAWLLRGGKAVALAPTPFSLLCALARQPGALLTKDALLDMVWGHQFVSESVLKTAISDLRSALGDNPRQPRIIETVPRRGYRFIAVPAAGTAPPQAPTIGVLTGPSELPSFIGRADAVARLRRAWSQACGGQRAVVWVAGEPGIGKTTLIEHFVAGLEGVAVARGQCVEHYGTGEPYLPVLEALAELCRKDADLPALMRAVAPTWLLQLPWLSTSEERDALGRELAGVGPDRMLREMGELLDRYTEQRPLLLVTEDLHWSDRATIQLIDHVARRRGRAGLMWLATFRVAEVVATDHPLNPLRRELRLHRLCEEIVLDPFSETEVAEYIAQRSPSLARDEASHVVAGVDRVLLVSIEHVAGDNFDHYLQWRRVDVGPPRRGHVQLDEVLYRLIAPDTGTHDIEVVFADSEEAWINSASYTGAHQTTPVDSDNYGTNTGDTQLAVANDLVVAANCWLVVAGRSSCLPWSTTPGLRGWTSPSTRTPTSGLRPAC